MIAPIAWASSKGYVNGYEDNTFRPRNVLTRGHVVTILWRMAGEPEVKEDAEGIDAAKAFTDVEAGEYYEKGVIWGAVNGIVKGTSNTTFSPGGSCTRAQMMTFIYRAKDLITAE